MPVKEGESTPTELIDLVGRRYEALVSLDTAPADKRTLEKELDVSRSTVDRAVRELEARSLVHWSENGYRTTLYGRSMLAVYESILNHMEYVQHAKPLLAVLPPTTEFDFSLLIDSDVYLAQKSAPQAPATLLTERLERATELKALYHSHFSPKLFDIIRTRVLQDELRAEIVFREPMFTHLQDQQSADIREMKASDDCSLHVAETMPYGLFLTTANAMEEVGLTVYGHSQQLNGIIVNDNTNAVSWARHVFEEYRNDAILQEEA